MRHDCRHDGDLSGPPYSEAWLYIASIHRMLKHLSPDPAIATPYQRRAAA